MSDNNLKCVISDRQILMGISGSHALDLLVFIKTGTAACRWQPGISIKTKEKPIALNLKAIGFHITASLPKNENKKKTRFPR
ncbi:MAG: hypothetical protein LUH03_07840 [Oscillospiraceae bacterium]|nr:hypothetical protein [Oscillospiraceae bacterium]